MTTPPASDPAGVSDPAGATAPLADQSALIRVGKRVRTRLAADPGAYRLPTEQAEIFAFGNFLSLDECQLMMAEIDQVARPSTVYEVGHTENYRTSYSGDVDPGDPSVRMIERRIDDLLGMEPELGESLQGQRYLPGQEFQAHYDWLWTLAEYWPREKKRGGQRSWTAMAYLNAVEEGGATDFTELGISIAPQAGALLVWNNATPEGAPNPHTMHAARPVIRGSKYVMTKWYRTRKWY